jgi:HD superfamily phosphohydrolase
VSSFFISTFSIAGGIFLGVSSRYPNWGHFSWFPFILAFVCWALALLILWISFFRDGLLRKWAAHLFIRDLRKGDFCLRQKDPPYSQISDLHYHWLSNRKYAVAWIETYDQGRWRFLTSALDEVWNELSKARKDSNPIMTASEEHMHQKLEVIANYLKRSEIDDQLQRALYILQRYNLPWSKDDLNYPNELPNYVKSVSNPYAEEIIRESLKLPSLYRLNFIKQMSTVCYSLKLDASHHCLPHALGSAETAGLLLEAVARPVPNHRSTADVSPEDKVATILYALLHDCFRGPMGHSLEIMRELLCGNDQIERLDKVYLKQNFEENLDIKQLVEDTCEKTKEGDYRKDKVKVYKTLELLIKGSSQVLDDDGKFFLKQIVDYQIDSDRIDYLLRDGLHLGEVVYDKNSWIDVLMSARVTQDPNHKNRKRIAFSDKYVLRIDHILSLRDRFYREYYEHPVKLALDEMLCHIVFYYLDHVGLFADEQSDEHKQLKSQFRKEFWIKRHAFPCFKIFF